MSYEGKDSPAIQHKALIMCRLSPYAQEVHRCQHYAILLYLGGLALQLNLSTKLNLCSLYTWILVIHIWQQKTL